MPITDYTFENGIFYAREHGKITKSEALEWSRYVRHHASENQRPIISLIDATGVTGIDADARRVFANTSAIPNYAMACIATGTLVSEISARIVSTTALDPHTHLFKTIDSARAFAEARIREIYAKYDAV